MRAATTDAKGATFWIVSEAVLRLTRLKVRCAAAHTAMPAPRKIDISVAAPSAVVVVCVVSGGGVFEVAESGGVFVATGIGTGGGGVITPDLRDGAKKIGRAHV